MQGSNQTTVTATGTAGAVSVILVWALSLAHIDMPAAVASAVTVIVAAVAGYLVPTRHEHPADGGTPMN